MSETPESITDSTDSTDSTCFTSRELNLEQNLFFSRGRYDGLTEVLLGAESRAVGSFLNGEDELACMWRSIRDELRNKCDKEQETQDGLKALCTKKS